MSRTNLAVGPWSGTNYTYGITRPFYNYIDNGGFVINQRRPGANTALAGSGAQQVAYCMDRWHMILPAGTGTFTAVPTGVSNTVSQYYSTTDYVELDGYLQLTGSAAGLPTGTRLQQFLPISTLKTLSGRWVTFSVWCYAPSVASQQVQLEIAQYFGTGGTPSASVVLTSSAATMAALSTWQLITYSVQLPSTSGKTMGSNADGGLFVRIYPDVSKAFNLIVAQAQLQEGPDYTGFHKKPFPEELQNCRQYYQKSFPYGVLPAQNSANVGRELFAYSSNGTAGFWSWRFPFPMFKAPSMIAYNPAAANALVRNYTRTNDAANTTLSATSVGFESQHGPGAGWVAGDLLTLNWEAKGDYSDPA